MSPLQVTFLGTGTSQGVPMIACPCAVCHSEDAKDTRLRSSVLLRWDQQEVVIDTGPDFRYQMLRAQVTHLDAVLLTHAHKDHIAGLDDIRAFNFLQQAAMPVYCTEATETALRREFAYAFAEHKYPGVPEIALHRIGLKPFEIAGRLFTPIQTFHAGMEVLGFRTGTFAYITDANQIPESERAKLQGLDVLVLNALRQEAHISHFTLAEAIALGQSLGAKQLYFTHISHQMGFHQAVNATLPAHMALAFDGLQLNLSPAIPV
ncbi:MAG: MBL fold metallo-hydrolase [Sphingobacteriales bacterium]|nr:MAG: MBL fold metallo-hydrolase [Sphingobacteriales bacterium]